MEQTEKNHFLFAQLIMSLHAEAMHFMGKIKHPVTDKIERNLEAARNAIDILEMLEEKTKGSSSAEEQQFLAQVLRELRLNYVDEAAKP
jgi:hypothetical protein